MEQLLKKCEGTGFEIKFKIKNNFKRRNEYKW